jgi:hypothetical protein
MPRRTALVVGLLAMAGIFLGVAMFARPSWRTASEAEVETWLDPAFQEMDVADPAARARFEALRGVWAGIPRVAPPKASFKRVPTPPKPDVAERLWRLSRQGALQRPSNAISPSSSDLATVSTGLGYDGNRLAKAGNSATAARRLAAALWLADQSATTSTDLYEYESVSESAIRGVDKYLTEALPRLAEKDLALLAAQMPPTPREAPLLRRALRIQLRHDLIPLLSDPYAWARRTKPGDPPEETLDSVLMGEMPDKLHHRRESYDADLTVRNFNRAFVPLLDNAMRSPGKYDLNGAKFTEDLARFLPISEAAGKTGFARKKAEFLYRLALRRTRNSYGDRLLHIWGNFLPAIQEGTNQTLSIRESMRTRIALYRYKKRFGHSAPSLNALVGAKLLLALPIDGFADGPMRYDPMRKRLWSVGRDHRDDGGTTKRMGQLFQPDYVWETP